MQVRHNNTNTDSALITGGAERLVDAEFTETWSLCEHIHYPSDHCFEETHDGMLFPAKLSSQNMTHNLPSTGT